MTSTEIEPRHQDVALFNGASADEIIGVAADVARQFADVVKKQRMFKRIGSNDHIQIEAWQTIGALTGVLAADGHVTELPWPTVWAPDQDVPDDLRDQYKQLQAARAVGRAYGFKAEFTAVKNGVAVGWGEGRCTRGEASKAGQDDYALASMAQTRAQSRALGAPLKFIVKLAGYETTPAEEMTAADPEPDAPPYGPWASDKQQEAGAAAVRTIAPQVDADQFVLAIGQNYDGVPLTAMTTLRALAKFIAAAGKAAGDE